MVITVMTLCMVPMQLLKSRTGKLTKLWTRKIRLECLLMCCRYKQSWARSPTTETRETQVYLKRSQNKSSISVIQEMR